MSVQTRSAAALWYEACGKCAVKPVELAPPQRGEARVRTLWSAVSRGTERLVFSGEIPPGERQRMRAPMQEGEFSFPVKYGYCAAGIVEDGPAEWLGRKVFVMHPHQDRFNAPLTALTPVPDSIPLRRAALAANMETVLNAVWDSGAGPGDRIVIVGAGLIGLLTASIAARLPGADVTVTDISEARRGMCDAIGARFVRIPADDLSQAAGADIVFHSSGTQAGLSAAMDMAGFEGCVVELSWHGDHAVSVPLGGAFHSQRLRLVSSQVGSVSAARRPRWTHARRLSKALSLLDDARLDALITAEISFGDIAAEMPSLLAPDAPGVCTLIRYGE